MFVADASITLEWFLPGQFSATAGHAFELARHAPIVVPSLWILETHAAILKLVRQRVLTAPQAQEIRVEIALLAKRVDGPLDQNVVDRTWEIATSHMMTFYDACYIELAWRLNLRIASSDTAIRAAAKKLEISLV